MTMYETSAMMERESDLMTVIINCKNLYNLSDTSVKKIAIAVVATETSCDIMWTARLDLLGFRGILDLLLDWANAKNTLHPIVCIIDGYEKSKEKQRTTELDDCREAPHIVKPIVWNGLFPLSAKSIEPQMHSGDGTRTKDQQGKGQKSQFFVSVIWLPCGNSPKDDASDEKETNAHGRPAEEPCSCRVLPMKLQATDDNTGKPNAEVDN
ncbi:hypothetical protein Nepgr_002299 [Nepenthes gracilis]|uniref:Uncharacterized protein n=1 Tax=Nepenthes gracilis TaxID=150966 RepID=A0AAD3P7N5_NEPGR|nr:hypothetical protein Nepgr_002299 [Nepenthes gracilis]